MGVHEELRRLVEEAGPAVLEDADSFRAALDDYLAEDVATRGELNLLVDAVRLGAFGRLMHQVDNGADVDRAVRLLGGELARDRGTSESASAAWALGVLAFAVGRIDADRLAVLRAVRERPVPEPGPRSDLGSTTVKRPTTLPDDDPPAETASSRRRVAAVVLAVLVVVALASGAALWATGRDEPADDREAARTPSAAAFVPLSVPGGVEVMKRVRTARTYRLTAARASSSVVLTNTAKRPVTVLWAEVVPKELADHVSKVTFDPATQNVLEADPIVFWRLRIPAGARRTVAWSTALPDGATASADYLARIAGWHREAVTRAEPQVTRELPAYVRAGEVVLTPVVPEPVSPKEVASKGASSATEPALPVVPDLPATSDAPPDPAPPAPRETKVANRAPRLSLSSRTTDELVGAGYQVSASDPDGDGWSIVSVSGAPAGIGRSGAHTLGGTVSHRAADVTTHRSNIRSRSFTVTVTVRDSRGAEARGSFTWTVRDTHLTMPSYIGKYGNSPNIPNLFDYSYNGCLDTSRPVDTIAKQSLAAGTPVRWGAKALFTYVHHSGGYPAC